MDDKQRNTLLLGFPEYQQQAKNIAEAAGLEYKDITIHTFPDGESKVQLPESLPEHVVLCRSLNDPNAKLVELILAADGARALGAKQLTLVVPYLAYMRQDKAFHPGEVVSQKAIGMLLAQYFEQVITVDSHLHRIHTLSQAIPAQRAINLTATRPMAEFLSGNGRMEGVSPIDHIDQPFLLGPDGESEQWVAAIAANDNWDYAVAHKQRFSDTDVRISLPERDYSNRHIVMVDDVASTGKTLINTAKALRAYQPASINVLVTHALFEGDSMEELQEVGVSNIWSSDSIPHPTNRVQLANLFADTLKRLVE